jgi:hypothetical protein
MFMSHGKSAGLVRRLVIGGAITVAGLAAGAGVAEAATSGGSPGTSSGSSATGAATTRSASATTWPRLPVVTSGPANSMPSVVLAGRRPPAPPPGSPNARPGLGSTTPGTGRCEHMGKAGKSVSASAFYG